MGRACAWVGVVGWHCLSYVNGCLGRLVCRVRYRPLHAWLDITNACTCIDDVVVYVGPGRVEVQCCISSDLRTAVLVVLVDTPTAAPVAEALCVVGKQRTVVRLQ